MNRLLTNKEVKERAVEIVASAFHDGEICCICDRTIGLGDPYAKVLSTSKGITWEKWAHESCIDGLAGKP